MEEVFSKEELEIIDKFKDVERGDLVDKLPFSQTGWKCIYTIPDQRFCVFSDDVRLIYARMKIPKEFENKFCFPRDLVKYHNDNPNYFIDPNNIEKCTSWYHTANINGNFVSYLTGSKQRHKEFVLKVTYNKHVRRNNVVELEPETKFIDANLLPFSSLKELVQFNEFSSGVQKAEELFHVKGGGFQINPEDYSEILGVIHNDKTKTFENALYEKILEEYKIDASAIENSIEAYTDELERLSKIEGMSEEEFNYRAQECRKELKASEKLLERAYVRRGVSILILNELIENPQAKTNRNNGNQPGENS